MPAFVAAILRRPSLTSTAPARGAFPTGTSSIVTSASATLTEIFHVRDAALEALQIGLDFVRRAAGTAPPPPSR